MARAAAGAPIGSVEQVVWGVRAVSRYLPGATCLTQAIAAQSLLTHCGFPSQVEIGVAKEQIKSETEAGAKMRSGSCMPTPGWFARAKWC